MTQVGAWQSHPTTSPVLSLQRRPRSRSSRPSSEAWSLGSTPPPRPPPTRSSSRCSRACRRMLTRATTQVRGRGPFEFRKAQRAGLGAPLTLIRSLRRRRTRPEAAQAQARQCAAREPGIPPHPRARVLHRGLRTPAAQAVQDRCGACWGWRGGAVADVLSLTLRPLSRSPFRQAQLDGDCQASREPRFQAAALRLRRSHRVVLDMRSSSISERVAIHN